MEAHGPRHVIRLAWPAIAFALLLTVVFADKAYTIDDAFFLEQAEHIMRSPTNPFGYVTVWGNERDSAAVISASGPGMAYLLVPVVAVGAPEWLAHGIVWACLAFAIIAATSLSLRLGANPGEARAVGFLLVATPAVLAMAMTVMPDVSALALGVVGLERLLAYRDEGRLSQGLVSAFTFALATAFRSHALLLIVIGGMLLLDCPRREWPKMLTYRVWPLALGLVVAFTILWFTRGTDSDVNLAGASIAHAYLGWVPRNATSFFAHYAHVVPLALPWLVIRRRVWHVWAVAGIGAALLAWVVPGAESRSWQLCIFAGLGLAVLVDVFCIALARGSWLLFTLGCWLWFPILISPYRHLPAKYLVLCAPAAVYLMILITRRLRPRMRRALLGVNGALALTLALQIVSADAHMAGLGREAASRLIAPRVAAGDRVWFTGTWGFQWYATKAGAEPLAAEPELEVGLPKPGDFLVGSRTRHPELLEALSLEHVESFHDDNGIKGHIMGNGAGFYSAEWGSLPWTWKYGPADWFDVWVVR